MFDVKTRWKLFAAEIMFACLAIIGHFRKLPFKATSEKQSNSFSIGY